MNVGLRYKRGKWNSECVIGYVDAYFVGIKDKEKKKSLSSYVFTAWGSPISWKASLHFVVALSSTKAKYVDVA